ncbi:MAG: phospho-N-acetylmuramoyl-pentapeptide-transferase [Eubacteriales bacterium]|nr:phospho-N-acetylmuramoyl-pentapeptide-transferase [Eubacteriales bacterium]NLF47649.1 phospho-N-acetylmuramoyl-pentapeptide-transferase [Clostridiales bacterium]
MSYGIIVIVGLLGLTSGILLTSLLIPVLLHKQTGQNIRAEGPLSHQKKAGTPSMGGIAIIGATIVSAVIGGFLSIDSAVIAAGFLLFALIGFLDDRLKVIKHENLGLRAWQKFGMQFLLAVLFAVYMAYFSDKGTYVFVPFVNEYYDFGIWYMPFIIFTILAMVNAVNLTDGLDGLAAGVTAIVALCMAAVAVYIGADPSGCFFAALMGACLGFLFYNRYPAKVFMGDTGSLALGGGIAVAAIIMKMELLLPVAGFVYVLEALSVVLQVAYFKATGGKRIFRMAPLHHHLEMGGMKETKVVIVFWMLTFICCALAMFIVF